ncbi:YchJ family protein [Microbacterium ulmi]|uniref:UPF0225 protein HLA99_02895 n=2 Tax=Microbacterium ulmi TaxID=179095 RepID=A0A7Y2LXX5_9MICO|nr:YchJ family metal-binding protein [Microbacterium ulmi]NNH02810.1 hypothetical protein [Microbacterium ulmi]
MSFGSGAGRRVLADREACPCGSGGAYGGCCGPVIRGGAAPTAEALMRSRYTAFAVGDERHLLATWHPRTRPDVLELDPRLTWTRLEILAVDEGVDGDETGVVEFRAEWRGGGGRGILHERSSFTRLRGRWCYLDGEVE